MILPCVHVHLFSERFFISESSFILLCNYSSWWNLVICLLHLLLFLNLLWFFLLLNTFRWLFLLLLQFLLEHNLSQCHFRDRFFTLLFSQQLLLFALFFTDLLWILTISIAVTRIVSLITFFFKLLAQVAKLSSTFL